nr:MAG TPA: hypothetical protein [Caudoviricetes sp.]
MTYSDQNFIAAFRLFQCLKKSVFHKISIPISCLVAFSPSF